MPSKIYRRLFPSVRAVLVACLAVPLLVAAPARLAAQERPTFTLATPASQTDRRSVALAEIFVGGCVEGAAELVGGEDVEAAIAHDGRRAGHGVEDALDLRPNARLGRASSGGAAGVATEEVDEVSAFGVVELERLGDAVDDVVGHGADAAPFDAGVVLDADPGEQGDLFSA